MKGIFSVIPLVHVFVFIHLGRPQVQCEVMGMVPFAYDDQYSQCTEEMETEISMLLETEKSLDPDFKGIWDKATLEWEKRKLQSSLTELPKGFRDEHGIAILIYTDKDYPSPEQSFPRRFNEAVRTSVTSLSDYIESFHYKALHYYMTTALHLFQPECRKVYRGIHDKHFEPPTGMCPVIRFGQFTSSSSSVETAKSFGLDSFFYITTCFGVDIGNLSTDRSENEVLIPGSEIFFVSNYTVEGHQFVITSTKQTCHHYNCAFLGGERAQACILDSDNKEAESAGG
ncbi:ecto-ADP-ribosyltransferase 5-like [Bombina bombina]|uniref:ecto-ADP-ribosyltransferase 5-like n=1 Tax=Bombina bombina TaxID=8345 RepID=UPI00235AA47F|nr:ecto-ADP-ribosyltransferase 5-like [Bombina bombina]XP_053564787.1 ecto-ADP-ribosyltransferase 5-like [Bombina bombina]